jgi:hypothetical protein
MNLLSINVDAKTKKGTEFGVLTGILYLAPSNESKVINVCPKASDGCRASCLYTAGRGAFEKIKQARISKTVLFWNDRDAFVNNLIQDISFLEKKAFKIGLKPASRLNGTSDISWESIKLDDKSLMEHFPDHQFYDYTKRIDRIRQYAAGKLPKNYHLTFSRSESNHDEVIEAMSLGVNVAVVFSGKSLPESYMGRTVINGDEHDARFLDPKNVVVGLKAKGKARKDSLGFVVNLS